MKLPFSFLVVIAAVLSAADIHAQSPASDAPLMARNLVTIDTGRHLNLVCVGSGPTTLVFEMGLGAHLLTWEKLVEPVARLARACFYDPAGYGYSDPPGRPSTAENAVDDLHRLLRRAHIHRPVLVAHSIGGLYATLYADHYAADLAGLVLIDPSFAEQDKDESPAELVKDDAATRAGIAHLRACAALAQAGKLSAQDHGGCFEFAPTRTAEEKSFLTYQMTRRARYAAMASELDSFHSPDGRGDIDSRQEEAARRSFGDLPMVVLTAAFAADPAASAADQALARRNWGSWKTGHDALAARSTRGTSIVVPDTSHFIPQDKPGAVVAAINDILAVPRPTP